MNFYKKNIIKGISLLLGAVFLYAGLTKVLELDKFYYQLGKSPLIPFGYNTFVGNAILFLELIIVILIYKNYVRLSLLISFGLMCFFSIYISYLLYFSYYIPCNCGGILGELSWENHLIFNIFLTFIAGITYILDYD